MNEKIDYFKEIPFDIGIVEELDLDVMKSAQEQGNTYLGYQFQTLNMIRDNCKMILSWLTGAILALSGGLVLEATSDSPDTVILVMSGYGCTAFALIAFYIVSNAMFKRTVQFAGDSPAHYFQDRVMKPLKGYSDEIRDKYITGWSLHEIQFRIMQNKAEQAHEVKVYRHALYFTLAAVSGGIILLGVLLLLGL